MSSTIVVRVNAGDVITVYLDFRSWDNHMECDGLFNILHGEEIKINGKIPNLILKEINDYPWATEIVFEQN